MIFMVDFIDFFIEKSSLFEIIINTSTSTVFLPTVPSRILSNLLQSRPPTCLHNRSAST